ncbi:MAG: hypothetical protein Q4A08_03525 [Bacteroidales bacterium]|nr:hypothetical protein [Bacteroidales bacterium]
MNYKSLFLTFFCFQLLTYVYSQDEDLKHYEIAGAKLGKKLARQVVDGYLDRVPVTNRNATLIGWERDGHQSGYHRPISFVGAMDGAVMASLAHSYKYQNYYHGPRKFNYRNKQENSTDISSLEIANITYADDDDDGKVGKDESAQIYFDLINTGETPLYGITPVIMAYKTKHLIISDPCPIDTLDSKSALRYVVEIMGDGKHTPSVTHLLLRIKYGHQQYSDISEIKLGTKHKKQ